jgi:hypothetical protein
MSTNMNTYVTLRTDNNIMVCKMNKPTALALTTESKGRWITNTKGQQVFKFKEDYVSGNEAFALYLWKGYYLVFPK